MTAAIEGLPIAVKQAFEADPNFNRNELAQQLGVNVRTVLKHLSRIKARGNGSSPPPDPNQRVQCRPAPKTIRLNELIDAERLDARKILREGLAAIPKGELAYDETLARDLRISRDRWREITRDDEWSKFRAILPNRKAVWGKPETIADLKMQDGVQ